MNDSDASKQMTRVIVIIMLAVVAWGSYHAVGAYLYNRHLGRPLMVLGCVVGFLGFWGLMLWSRRRRLERRNAARPGE